MAGIPQSSVTLLEVVTELQPNQGEFDSVQFGLIKIRVQALQVSLIQS